MTAERAPVPAARPLSSPHNDSHPAAPPPGRAVTANVPYPTTIGQGDGPGGMDSPRAGQTGTLRTSVRSQQRSARRSASLPLSRGSDGPRHAAAREAAREQRLLEDYCAARREANQERREYIGGVAASWNPETRPAGTPPPMRSSSPPRSGPEPQERPTKRAYGKFNYAVRRDAPAVPRNAATGTPVVSPDGQPAPHHTTPPARRSGGRPQRPVGKGRGYDRVELSPRRNRATGVPPASGRSLWGEFCEAAQFDFTCEELQVLNPSTLRRLAIHFGFADPQELPLLLQHHAKVQAGEEPARNSYGQPERGKIALVTSEPQDTWVRQSQQVQKGYSHLNYGDRRNQPTVRRSTETGQPVVTRRQEVEHRQRRIDRRATQH